MTDPAEKTVLVLQGGGALGAYQAGAYEALCEAGHTPNWVAGISIGSVNAAIIAGNPPEKRAERLREFWDRVSSWLLGRPLANDDNSRRIFNETSAALAAASGVPGFFEPRVPPAVLMPQGTPEAISVYDTSPLRATLLELVDFDLLNSGLVRVSLGAVQVKTGNMKYFDTARGQTVGPEHVMASGALPPGFPPIEIDGQPYWDGGLVSNTPLQFVLEKSGPREDMVIFQIDLFSAKGSSAAEPVRDRPAGEGDPLFEPHPPQHRHLLRAAGHPQGNSPFAADAVGATCRQSRLAIARPPELQCRHHHRATHSPACGLLDPIQRL